MVAFGLPAVRRGGVWGRRQPTVGEDREPGAEVVHGGEERQATATARAAVTQPAALIRTFAPIEPSAPMFALQTHVLAS